MVHSIELKFGTWVTGHRSTYCIGFFNLKIIVFYRSTKKNILIHYSLWSQIIISILMSKRYFWGNSQTSIIILILVYIVKYLQIENPLNTW